MPKKTRRKKEQVEIKNQADAVIFQTEKLLKESGDKMKPEDKKELEEKLDALKKAKDTDQYDEIKKKMEEMNQVAQKIGAAMYSASAQQGGAAEDKPADKQAGGEEKKEEPVEGEVEENKK